MFQLIAQGFRMVAEALGFVNKRTELKNAPDVRDRAKSQSEADQVAKTTQAVATGDTKEIRNELAE